MPTALFVLLEHLPLTALVSMIAILLIVTFFVTSSDSGSLVIDTITSGGNKDPAVWQRVFFLLAEDWRRYKRRLSAARCLLLL